MQGDRAAEDTEEARKPIGFFMDRQTFLDSFNSGKKTIYYRGPGLAFEIETDKTGEAKRFRDWIWSYVVRNRRGTFVQKRLAQFEYLYFAIPRRRFRER